MKPIIYIDMDNTINKFWIPYIDYYNKTTGLSVSKEREIMEWYSLPKCLNIKDTPFEIEADANTMGSDRFWIDDMPVYDNAQEVLERLYNKYDVYILSVPWKGYIGCVAAKILWMRKHFPFFDEHRLIFNKHKHLMRGDVLIDDKTENLEGFIGTKIAIDYLYNRNAKVDFRSESWLDIEKYLEEKYT